MISLTCTSCKTPLEIDDAFAGGVCRCQHCGTIQTVPANLKNSAAGTGATAGTAGAAGAGRQKALYERKSAAATPEAAAPAGGGQVTRAARPQPSSPAASDRPTKWLIALSIGLAAAVAAAVLIGIAVYLLS